MNTTTQQAILIEGIADAVRDTLNFAIVENSLALTTTPLDVREMADGSGRFAVFGTFVVDDLGEYREVHTRCMAGSFNEVEVI